MPPLFLLRDGSKRTFAVVPHTLDLFTYRGSQQQPVHALLDPVSEKRLIQAQPRPAAVSDLARQAGHSRRQSGRLRAA